MSKSTANANERLRLAFGLSRNEMTTANCLTSTMMLWYRINPEARDEELLSFFRGVTGLPSSTIELFRVMPHSSVHEYEHFLGELRSAYRRMFVGKPPDLSRIEDPDNPPPGAKGVAPIAETGNTRIRAVRHCAAFKIVQGLGWLEDWVVKAENGEMPSSMGRDKKYVEQQRFRLDTTKATLQLAADEMAS